MRVLVCVIVLLSWGPGVHAKTPSQAAVVSAHPLATEVGIDVLRQGGNAFDAAAAVSAVLAVVEPYASGLGGGGFWLLYRAADKREIMIDGRERAPLYARPNMYLDKDGEPIRGRSLNGPLAAGIPGVPAGIDHLIRNYGRLSTDQILTPALRLARQGFQVTERYQKLMAFRLSAVQAYRHAADIFLKDNAIPEQGTLIRQPDLANTLQRLINQGIGDFYYGKLGKQLLEGVNNDGGIWQQRDLTHYQIKEREPVVFHYHNMRIVSASLPSSGGIVLAQMLKMLSHFNVDRLSEVDKKHVLIEVMRRAYRDRAAYLGDPDYTAIPVGRLLDQHYLEGLALDIDMQQAGGSTPLASQHFPSPSRGKNTTHFSVIDQAGNRVAATLSINLPFGSGYAVPGTGILLNNEMDDFSSKSPNAYGLIGRGQPNRIEAGKRPLSSMTPTFVEYDDRVAILGTPGGSRIITMVLLAILDMAKGNLPASWVSIPRFHHQFFPDILQFERGALSESEQEILLSKGHVLEEKTRPYGNMQAIMWWNEKNLLFTASDPRGEGTGRILFP